MKIECIICSENYTDFGDVVSITCGHVFHSKCLQQWFKKSKSCPTCRRVSQARSMRKLFFSENQNESPNVKYQKCLEKNIDDLKSEVAEKDSVLKHSKRKILDLQVENSDLRGENEYNSLNLKNMRKKLKEYEETQSKEVQLQTITDLQREKITLLESEIKRLEKNLNSKETTTKHRFGDTSSTSKNTITSNQMTRFKQNSKCVSTEKRIEDPKVKRTSVRDCSNSNRKTPQKKPLYKTHHYSLYVPAK